MTADSPAPRDLAVDFWEPWLPEPGQRVRYVFKPECPGVYGIQHPTGHPPEFDGLIGTMYEVYRFGLHEPGNGHRFLVKFDNERRIMAAALELEPVASDRATPKEQQT